jgi:uncharacterized protein
MAAGCSRRIAISSTQDGVDSVRIDGIIWLENVERKIWEKHRVRSSEVEAILDSRPHVRFVETGLREGEDLYAALGQTDAGRHLIVYFLYKPQSHEALVVTARGMTRKERRQYAKAK